MGLLPDGLIDKFTKLRVDVLESNQLSCHELAMCSLDFAHTNSVGSFLALTDFEGDGITVGDFSGYLGNVNEEIIATFDLNKSVSFYLVKPLDSSLRHGAMPVLQVLEVKGWEDQSKPVV